MTWPQCSSFLSAAFRLPKPAIARDVPRGVKEDQLYLQMLNLSSFRYGSETKRWPANPAYFAGYDGSRASSAVYDDLFLFASDICFDCCCMYSEIFSSVHILLSIEGNAKFIP